MLTKIHTVDGAARSPRRERRLWHDGTRHMRSLGCATCPEKELCGGLQIKEPMFDCLDFCCGNPASCDRVCRNHPEFADHYREIETFDLNKISRLAPLVTPSIPPAIPMLFHGSSRALALSAPAVALPLSVMFNRRNGIARHFTRESLNAAYGIEQGTLLVLSGTDHDAPLERWWSFGEPRRRELIRVLKRLGVALTTTPNYSLFIDAPRWDDMHAMKRIALVHHEFLSEGLPAALHVNGRTDTDFRRWTDYVAARPEITHLAYEFTTGTGWAGRQEQHAAWLSEMAAAIGRPLTLVLRGGVDILPVLARAFTHITVLDTSSFMKTMMRKRASLNGHLEWLPSPTEKGAPVDDLFAHNVGVVQTWINRKCTSAERN